MFVGLKGFLVNIEKGVGLGSPAAISSWEKLIDFLFAFFFFEANRPFDNLFLLFANLCLDSYI